MPCQPDLQAAHPSETIAIAMGLPFRGLSANAASPAFARHFIIRNTPRTTLHRFAFSGRSQHRRRQPSPPHQLGVIRLRSQRRRDACVCKRLNGGGATLQAGFPARGVELRELDSDQRPRAYEARELPTALSRILVTIYSPRPSQHWGLSEKMIQISYAASSPLRRAYSSRYQTGGWAGRGNLPTQHRWSFARS